MYPKSGLYNIPVQCNVQYCISSAQRVSKSFFHSPLIFPSNVSFHFYICSVWLLNYCGIVAVHCCILCVRLLKIIRVVKSQEPNYYSHIILALDFWRGKLPSIQIKRKIQIPNQTKAFYLFIDQRAKQNVLNDMSVTIVGKGSASAC